MDSAGFPRSLGLAVVFKTSPKFGLKYSSKKVRIIQTNFWCQGRQISLVIGYVLALNRFQDITYNNGVEYLNTQEHHQGALMNSKANNINGLTIGNTTIHFAEVVKILSLQYNSIFV